jgi:hypothetical protein
MCCSSAKHAALKRKIKDWLVRNQNIVSEWGDMSIRQIQKEITKIISKHEPTLYYYGISYVKLMPILNDLILILPTLSE